MQSRDYLISANVLGNKTDDNEIEAKDDQKGVFNDGLKTGSFKVTVETETVQVPAGSLAPKLRKGIETMKASRAKKRHSRLTNVPSKSEVFAAKIASAIDENIDSDSDETFVYETNTRSPHQLSRTSSISSIVSHSRHIDGKMCHSGKHSMKFTNHSWSSDMEHKDPVMILSDFNRSPGRISAFPSSRTSTKIETGFRSPHRIGSRTTSCPSSPHYKYQKSKYYDATCHRNYIDRNAGSFCETHEEFYPHERIPLLYKNIGCFTNSQYHECYPHNKRKRYISFGKISCIFVFFFILFACIVLFMMITRPLQEAKVSNITNVVVSPQVLIMDLEMVAFNPNFWQISIQQADIGIFSSKPWSSFDMEDKIYNNSEKISESMVSLSKVEKNDIVMGNFSRPSSLNSSSKYQDELILLGRVFQLDVPFVFPSAFCSKSLSRSIAQFRLKNSDHANLKNGSFIWNYIVEHEFHMVIKGFLKYSPSFFSRKQHLIQIDQSIDVYH